MNIRKIASQVAFYLQKSRSEYVDAEGNDFIITALNTARKKAELQHDFINHQAQAWVSVDPVNGALMSTAQLVLNDVNTDTAVRVKAVDTAYIQDGQQQSQNWWPIWVDPKKLLAIKSKERNYRYRGYPSQYGSYADDPLSKYPGDYRGAVPSRPFRGYFLGEKLFMDPPPSAATICRMDCQLWSEDYVPNQVRVFGSALDSTAVSISSDFPANFEVGAILLGQSVVDITTTLGTIVTLSDFPDRAISIATIVDFSNFGSTVNAGENYSDWFVEQGFEYLLWSAVVDCNMFARQFVPRETGYLSPPEKMRDEAFQRLVDWDNFQWEQGRQPMAIR